MSKSVRRLSAAVTSGALSAIVLSATFGGASAQAAVVQHAAPIPVSGVYTVQEGDTLGSIATRYGVSLGSLFVSNNLSVGTVIHPGQKVRIGAAQSATAAISPAAASAAPASDSCMVKSGDTLSAIATRHGVSLAAVLSANNLDMRATIYPGQKIFLSASSAATVSIAADAVQLENPAPDADQLKTLIATTAGNMDVDPSLALAFAMQESTFNQDAVSSTGAIGVMQIMPSSGVWASQLLGRNLDLHNAQDNVTAGLVLLKALIHTSPDQKTAIASYYQGQTSVTNRGMFDDTKAYVDSVLTYQQSFR